MMDQIIGNIPFVDGVHRDVFLAADGSQYVLGYDGERVYGIWIATAEVLDGEPFVVQEG